jgi:hypothetical protein
MALATGLVTVVGAQPATVGRQTVRAAVVVLEADRPTGVAHAPTGAPYAFFNLQSRSTSKPTGWNFVNPVGPTTVTDRVKARWDAIDLINLQIGAPITRRNAAYWELFLTEATDDVLANFDILLVAPRVFLSLNPLERERLRRFVDAGGILWQELYIPSAGGGFGLDVVNNSPIPLALQSLAGTTQSDFFNPLLTVPNTLGPAELNALNIETSRTLAAVPVPETEAIYSVLSAESYRMRPVSLAGSGSAVGATIGVSRIGDGYVVTTTRAVAQKLNRGAANDGFTATAGGLDFAGESAAKLVVNMVYLRSGFTQSGGGSRRSGSTPTDLNPPLLSRFDIRDITLPNDAANTQPVIWNGMVFVSAGSRVRCYDVNPSQDLDGDGDPDDGVRDLNVGAGFDLLWESDDLGTQISAPAMADVPEATRRVSGRVMPRQQVVAAGTNGNLYVFNADPRDRTNPREAVEIVAPSPASYAGAPNTPSIHEGLAITADNTTGGVGNTGRIWIANLRNGTRVQSAGNNWFIGGVVGANSSLLPQFTSGPSVAYIPIADGSGGVDRVMYIPFGNESGGGGGNTPPGFTSVWLGVRGERSSEFNVEAGQLRIATRAMDSGNLPVYIPQGTETVDQGTLAPRVTFLGENGNPLSQSEVLNLVTGSISEDNGQLVMDLRSGVTETTFNNAVRSVRTDYTIDWGRAQADQRWSSLERGRVNLPTTDLNRRVLGNLAVTPRGVIFMVLGGDPSGSSSFNRGSVFAFREDQGRGGFRCVMRYDLFPDHQIPLNQGSATSYQSNFTDLDVVRLLTGPTGPISGDRVANVRFVSGPAVTRNRVVVSAMGQKTAGGFPVNVGMLMVFDANPQAPSIPVGNVGEGFSLVQPDFLRSGSGQTPDQFSTLPSTNVRVDDRGVIRLDNLMNIVRGQVQNCLSLSQPVILRRPGTGDTLVNPDAIGGRWNPLLWYTVIHSLEVQTPPTIAGNTVFVAGRSLLPTIVNSGFPPIAAILDGSAWRGMAYGISLDISDESLLVPNPDRTWIRQLVQIRGDISGSITGNPNFRWPFLGGTYDATSFATRLNQSVLGSPSNPARRATGIVVGDAASVAWAEDGLFVFNRADVLVADEGRLVRFGADGTPTWTLTATLASRASGESGVGRSRPLVKPTRAYSVGGSDTVIVDSGSNRVLRVDGSGVERRAIERFRLDNAFVPEGFSSGNPLALNNPRDAITWGEYITRGAQAVVTNQQPTEYWVNWLIADTGNRRLLWIVDRYAVDAQGNIGGAIYAGPTPQLGVLYWQSPASLSGGGFDYSSIARVWVPASAGFEARWVYVAGIGRGTPTRSSVGLDGSNNPTAVNSVPSRDGNGGIIVFDTRYENASQVFNTLQVPSTLNARLWDEQSNQWTLNTSANRPASNQRIGSVRSLTARVISGGATPTLLVMFTDSTGVYEAGLSLGVPNTNESLSATWMLPSYAYRTMRRSGIAGAPEATNPGAFSPVFARRLDNGDVLVVNGYTGRRRGLKNLTTGTFAGGEFFSGEVLQLDGSSFDLSTTNLGFLGSQVIRFELTSTAASRTVTLPMFADRR